MSWLSGLSLVLAMLLSLRGETSTAHAQSGNLVGNAGFETGVPTTPSPLPFPWAPYPSTLPASQAGGERTGAHTGCCNGHLTPSANVPALYQYIPVTSVPSSGAVTPYQKYKLDVWVRTHVIDASIAWWTNGTGTVRCDPTVNSPGYVLKTCEFVLPGNTPAGSDKFHVNAWTAGNGWVIVDDWSLTRVPPTTLPNAIGAQYLSARGSFADIGPANPNLNGDAWVYHRTGIRSQSGTYKFGEIGWWKKSDGTIWGLISARNNAGLIPGVEFSYSAGSTHNFILQYDTSSQKYQYFYDYNFLIDQNLDFADGTSTFSGGEVQDGLASMGNVLYSNNRKLTWDGSAWTFSLFGGHTEEIHPANSPYPYRTSRIDDNTWRVTGYD